MIFHLVPERALPGPVVWGEADVVAGHHGAALEVPVGHSEPGAGVRPHKGVLPLQEVLGVPLGRQVAGRQ